MPPYKGNFDYLAYKDALAKITIPPKIKCKNCKTIRNSALFSKRQLEELRKAILNGKATGLNGPGYAACRTCIAHQVVEMTCIVCDMVKPLDCFTKAQRRDPDNARCANCVQGHLDTEPVNQESESKGLLLDDATTLGTSALLTQSEANTLQSLRALSIQNNEALLSEPTSVRLSKRVPVTSNASAAGANGATARGENEANSRNDEGVWATQVGPLAPEASEDTQINAATTVPETKDLVAQNALVDAMTNTSTFTSPTPSLFRGKISGFGKIAGPRYPKGQAPNMYQKEPAGAFLADDSSDGDNLEDWV